MELCGTVLLLNDNEVSGTVLRGQDPVQLLDDPALAPPGLWEIAIASNSTTLISSSNLPKWATEEADAEYLCAWSSAPNEAQVQMIRRGDDIDEEWKDYRYMLKRRDGKAYMSRPIKDFEHGKHHTDFIPPWNIRSFG